MIAVIVLVVKVSAVFAPVRHVFVGHVKCVFTGHRFFQQHA